jgi:hypothetical protein
MYRSQEGFEKGDKFKKRRVIIVNWPKGEQQCKNFVNNKPSHQKRRAFSDLKGRGKTVPKFTTMKRVILQIIEKNHDK